MTNYLGNITAYVTTAQAMIITQGLKGVDTVLILGMGFVKVKATVWNIDEPGRTREVELLVDTGSTYTVLPARILNELGIKPMGIRRFRLTDGRVVERNIGVMGIEVQGFRAYTIVVFGDEARTYWAQ